MLQFFPYFGNGFLTKSRLSAVDELFFPVSCLVSFSFILSRSVMNTVGKRAIEFREMRRETYVVINRQS